MSDPAATVDSLLTLTQAVRSFVAARDWERFHSPKNLAMALCVEAAELAERFQWLSESESGSLTERQVGQVADEVGDVLIYLVRICDVLRIDPVRVAQEKLVKNEMKYPADLVRGKALKYSEY